MTDPQASAPVPDDRVRDIAELDPVSEEKAGARDADDLAARLDVDPARDDVKG